MLPDDLKITTDREEIRQWAKAHNGRPAVIRRPTRGGGVGIVDIDLAGVGNDEDVQPISWEDFFDYIEAHHLAFAYEKESRPGEQHWYHELVKRDQR